jgi:hypothetical protein
MYNSYYVHNYINHGALAHTYVSTASLLGWPSSNRGVRLLIRALKSPQTITGSCGCSWSIMASIISVASGSGIFLLTSEGEGGR